MLIGAKSWTSVESTPPAAARQPGARSPGARSLGARSLALVASSADHVLLVPSVASSDGAAFLAIRNTMFDGTGASQGKTESHAKSMGSPPESRYVCHRIWRNREEQTICIVPSVVGKEPMRPRRISGWLIVLTVAMGLLAAPLSVPALAALHLASAADGMQSMDDMPCCPDQQDQKARDCGSCPFTALCMMTMTMPAPDSVRVLVSRNFLRSKFPLPDDLMIDGLGERPPDHPPRTIV